MKALLLHKDHDFDTAQALPWNEAALTQDLELNILFNAMAKGDEFLFDIARKVIFSGLSNTPETILYRQDILRDCLEHPSVVRDIYDIAVKAIESRKSSWFSVFTKHPSSILSSSIGMMHLYLDKLKQLSSTVTGHAGKFSSEGFTRFFNTLGRELGGDYFAEIEAHLDELRFRDGMLMSGQLGDGNKGIHYTLRKLQDKRLSWLEKLFARKPPGYIFHIHPRDESGIRALSKLNDEGINRVANALAQSNDHILSFFSMLRAELAFYVGCLNLSEQLARIAEPVSFPTLAGMQERSHSFKELYDACLALRMNRKIVGNELQADGDDLIIITGANQGGKSTFLRSIGLAQLMMQSGMFVPAGSFTANVCSSLITHFKREEDTTMKSGKFDEELSRMNEITDHIAANALILFNESFAATNEKEGSEIARQIVTALVEKRIKVFFVTHLYQFAHRFYTDKRSNVLFLRAERQSDTSRTFRLVEGEPLETSYGPDLYDKIFGHDQ